MCKWHKNIDIYICIYNIIVRTHDKAKAIQFYNYSKNTIIIIMSEQAPHWPWHLEILCQTDHSLKVVLIDAIISFVSHFTDKTIEEKKDPEVGY